MNGAYFLLPAIVTMIWAIYSKIKQQRLTDVAILSFRATRKGKRLHKVNSDMLLWAIMMLPLFAACNNGNDTPGVVIATYQGIAGYGTVEADEVKDPDFDGYIFATSKGVKNYSIIADKEFAIQNILEEVREYKLTIDEGRIIHAECTDNLNVHYTPPVACEPGKRTLKNLIATALQPVGTTLYIYGGGWDWQDEKSSNLAMHIGVADEWVHFFNVNNDTFNYKFVPGTGNQVTDPATSYYPFHEWNQYYYAGLDCSGFIGWVTYNVFNTESTTDHSKGYVMSATSFAKTLSQTYGYGTFTQEPILDNEAANPLRCGDIVSIKGHVWMCIGTCSDGSALIMHSTPSESRKGEMGGGVQMSAIYREALGSDCEAYRIADHYMKTYFSEWYKRYPVVTKPYEQYTDVTSDARTGKFSWAIDGSCLSDPDGYASMTVEQILNDLFR